MLVINSANDKVKIANLLLCLKILSKTGFSEVRLSGFIMDSTISSACGNDIAPGVDGRLGWAWLGGWAWHIWASAHSSITGMELSFSFYQPGLNLDLRLINKTQASEAKSKGAFITFSKSRITFQYP